MKNPGKKTTPPRKRTDQTEILAGLNQKPLVLKKARFLVTRGRDEGKEMVLETPHVSIGTLAENDLVLVDPTVSRKHAIVEETSGGYVLRDLDSTNGTFLDGVRIREGYLSAGSVLRLGQTEMIFSPLEERIDNPRPNSYVSKLVAEGENAIVQKIGEEATELVIAAKDGKADRKERKE